MIICIDIDGPIAKGRKGNQFDEGIYSDKANWAYENCEIVPEAVESINELYKDHKIILYSARWHADYEKTVKWLEKYGVKYHQLILGKPLADRYIDDRGLTYTNWKEVMNELRETKLKSPIN
jgi:uncharacterized HAD superfamily protein